MNTARHFDDDPDIPIPIVIITIGALVLMICFLNVYNTIKNQISIRFGSKTSPSTKAN